jgi:superfamily II DNA or RNA helicase
MSLLAGRAAGEDSIQDTEGCGAPPTGGGERHAAICCLRKVCGSVPGGCPPSPFIASPPGGFSHALMSRPDNVDRYNRASPPGAACDLGILASIISWARTASRQRFRVAGYFSRDNSGFSLFRTPKDPAWRSPQLGSLGAIAANWSLGVNHPILVSMPTGSGKTAVAVSAAFLASATRVLVLVPSTDLRGQLASVFRSQDVLRAIGALHSEPSDDQPHVHELTGLVASWSELSTHDVVVALPNSISPSRYSIGNQPPPDLFDLIIIDEAHHAPAPTWRAVLDAFPKARSLLLTATPRRSDNQQLPGEHIFHYPLRRALNEGIFQPVRPVILDLADPRDRTALDNAIRDHVAQVLAKPEHASSSLMVRAATRDRARRLASLYAEAGIPIEILHSELGKMEKDRITAGLRAGSVRSVAVVGMLIEGFDLPSLRVVAYHDKHKSIPITTQLIGRLARADRRYPQDSVLITARDIDVYPGLQGVVRVLYGEDPDWTEILPGIIDDEVAARVEDRKYAQAFGSAVPEVSVESLTPLRSVTIWEFPRRELANLELSFQSPPAELLPDSRFGRATILHSGLNGDKNTFIVVTRSSERPRWHRAPGLDKVETELHVISYRASTQTNMPPLIFVNSRDAGAARQLLESFDPDHHRQVPDPGMTQAILDGIERTSVSSVGVRNNYATLGSPSYKTFAGKGVDRGIRETDHLFSSLGHAMLQASDVDGSFVAGIASEKAKYWETRYSSLRDYDAFLTNLSASYWFPKVSASGPLLPRVSRGSRLTSWPSGDPVAAVLDPVFLAHDWRFADKTPLSSLELTALPATEEDLLPLALRDESSTPHRVVWSGIQKLDGSIEFKAGQDDVYRGYGDALHSLSHMMQDWAPTIFFRSGKTVRGVTVIDSRLRPIGIEELNLEPASWADADIEAETRRSKVKTPFSLTVQEALVRRILTAPARGRHKWILNNDGAGEIADYLVVEVAASEVFVDLYHCKGAGGPMPAVRVTDIENVASQAIKSRRWITDSRLWEELGRRLTGETSPALKVETGAMSPLGASVSLSKLRLLLGLDSGRGSVIPLTQSRPIVTGSIAIVQPGLSVGALRRDLASNPPPTASLQTRDILAAAHDAIVQVATPRVIASP